MATDIRLYVLADPIHAAALLAESEGSGFDPGHSVNSLRFYLGGDSPESRRKAMERDAVLEPRLTAARERAAASIAAMAPGRTVRGTNVPVTSLPDDRTKAMALCETAPIRWDEGSETAMHRLMDRYMSQAFVIDATAYNFLLVNAERMEMDLAPLRQILDEGFGRVATLLLD